MSSTITTLRFQPEIAELFGQETFTVTRENSGFIRIRERSRFMKAVFEEVAENQHLVNIVGGPHDNAPEVRINAYTVAGWGDLFEMFEYLNDSIEGQTNVAGETLCPRLEALYVAFGTPANAVPCRFCVESRASDKAKFFFACIVWRGNPNRCMNCVMKMRRGPMCDAEEHPM
ncbi:hypothetical protein Micbo1qcDRAFT_223497 [Microdochium bolleyi]|uniref:Uncharacterized protein n=1 Tax=Microdochium bolleyi TaxID=196109 RepID=A0A136IK32_9PEZI|nr:hypothetical protein Micbo1qcDRAFT_223497 [Microdochium bolleyi]